MTKHTFKVDTRLAMILSENYRSSEKALKELVDNAWDADAETVQIILPEPLTDNPIIIQDDGCGMTDKELQAEYMNIASDRRARRGDLTTVKKRKVKGRKGVGKFAGFMAASYMKMETWSRGKKSKFELDRNFLDQHDELQSMPINLTVKDDNTKEKGTCITLSSLHHNMNFPDHDKFRQLLIQEYGRENDFNLIINGKELDIDDIQGSYKEHGAELDGIGNINLRFTVSDKKPLKNPGIVLRVAGKTIGEPSFFGLDKADDFPPKLLNKCFGELEADGLIDDVTADWGAIIEGSKSYEKIEEIVQPILREKFKEVYGQEINLAKARLQKEIQSRVRSLPEHKREFAEKAIKKILERFYQEPESKIAPVVNVLLDALERSDYRTVLEHINEAKHSEIAVFAEALDEFGLLEMARMSEQASKRLEFIDYLEELIADPKTLEKDVHKAIEKNLWLFGPEYSLFSSNMTLKKQIEDFLNKKYIGGRAEKRPDLMLSENLRGERLLIEFKRPSHNLKYEDYQQATAYRNDFRKNSFVETINVYLIGGSKGSDLPQDQDREDKVRIILFSDLLSSARRQFQWLLEQLMSNP